MANTGKTQRLDNVMRVYRAATVYMFKKLGTGNVTITTCVARSKEEATGIVYSDLLERAPIDKHFNHQIPTLEEVKEIAEFVGPDGKRYQVVTTLVCLDDEDKGSLWSLTCTSCGKSDETVQERFCGYHQDISGRDVYEVVCDDCEHEHLMDI